MKVLAYFPPFCSVLHLAELSVLFFVLFLKPFALPPFFVSVQSFVASVHPVMVC